ncbi:hypothetical protein BGZ83_004040, partial [Gryganskiella cystojenkinii]
MASRLQERRDLALMYLTRRPPLRTMWLEISALIKERETAEAVKEQERETAEAVTEQEREMAKTANEWDKTLGDHNNKTQTENDGEQGGVNTSRKMNNTGIEQGFATPPTISLEGLSGGDEGCTDMVQEAEPLRGASETATMSGLLCGLYVGDKEPGDLDPHENLDVEPQNELQVCSHETQLAEETVIQEPVVSIDDLERDRNESRMVHAVDNNPFTETQETETTSQGPDKDNPNYEEREVESRGVSLRIESKNRNTIETFHKKLEPDREVDTVNPPPAVRFAPGYSDVTAEV